MNHSKTLRTNLITVVNENGLDKLLGVSDRVVGDYLMASLDALSTIVAVAKNQATINLLTRMQNDAINQAVNGLGNIQPAEGYGIPSGPSEPSESK